jgi:hypothetical protein
MNVLPEIVPYSARIRDWLRSLFATRYSMQLEADLAEARRERDYFKGRAERLELMLLPGRNPVTVRAAVQPLQNMGRKNWAQIEQENAKRMIEQENAKRMAEEAAKKEN